MKLFKLLSYIFMMSLLTLPAWAGDEKKDTVTQLPASIDSSKIMWLAYDEGLSKAKKEGKHLFLDFTAKWCGYCKKMDASTFVEPEIVKLLNNDFVAVKIDGDSEKELNIDGYKVTEKNLSKLEYKVRGYPTFWFLDSKGAKLGALSGYQTTPNLLTTLQYVKDKKYETEQKADTTKKKPENN